MTRNRPVQGDSDLVSRNIRGAVSALVEHLDQKDILLAWLRAEFSPPEELHGINISNAWSYEKNDIYGKMSASVHWADPVESTYGLKALSNITTMALDSVDDFDINDKSFWPYYEQVKRACREDGLRLDENGVISQSDVVTLEDLDFRGLNTTDGVLRQIKKLNQAITQDQDPSDVIGHSKSLIEAVSAAIMDAHGIPAEESRGKNVLDRVSEVHKLLGIKSGDKSTDRAVVALSEITKGLNKLVQAMQHLRNDLSDAGHANHTVPQIDPENAQLAVDCTLAWCRYALAIQFRHASEAPF
ncbi:abortive infection family protein [Corynebacterium variabile]|uniref:abortive infection family protein n=1 Tax=Corynebacterium variabile TaxID=1727 RepID=UPI0009DB1B7A|nr:abortive infection family protein [Corynebacterium variabile]